MNKELNNKLKKLIKEENYELLDTVIYDLYDIYLKTYLIGLEKYINNLNLSKDKKIIFYIKLLEYKNTNDKRIESFIKAEIFQILDYLDFLDTSNKGTDRNNIDYNLNVFKKNKDQKLSIESYNYREISAKEIITSNYLIYKDLADKMLKENNDKEKVKEEIEKILKATEQTIFGFIDKSTQGN